MCGSASSLSNVVLESKRGCELDSFQLSPGQSKYRRIVYVCGYACKDSEPTGATADVLQDMVDAVNAADAD